MQMAFPVQRPTCTQKSWVKDLKRFFGVIKTRLLLYEAISIRRLLHQQCKRSFP